MFGRSKKSTRKEYDSAMMTINAIAAVITVILTIIIILLQV